VAATLPELIGPAAKRVPPARGQLRQARLDRDDQGLGRHYIDIEPTGLRREHSEDLTGSYVLTLRHWRERFRAAAVEAARLGYDRRFRRLWELYLCYAEAGFSEGRIGDFQLLLSTPAYRESRSKARPLEVSFASATSRGA
jgi:hypothetical protein